MAADRRRRGGKTIKDRLARLEELLPAPGRKSRITWVVCKNGKPVKIRRDDGSTEPFTDQAIPRFAGIKAGFDPDELL